MATNVGNMAVAIAVIGLVVGAGSYVYAGQATNSALNSLKSNELSQTQSELDELETEISKAKSDLRKVDNEQEETEAAVKQAKEELRQVSADLAQTKSQFATARTDLQKVATDAQKTGVDLQKALGDLEKAKADLTRTNNLALSSYMRILIDKVIGEMIEVKGTLDTPGSNITRRVGTVRGPILGTFRDTPWPATMKPAADKGVAASNKLIGDLTAGNRDAANKAFQELLDVLDGELFRAFRNWSREAGIPAPRLEFPELFGED
jgi:multidrug efflux pump subunit AcrA (membrane-fusion protein)